MTERCTKSDQIVFLQNKIEIQVSKSRAIATICYMRSYVRNIISAVRGIVRK